MITNERDSSYWTRKRFSRRQALRLGALGGASALTMLGCQTQSQPRTEAPAAASPAAATTPLPTSTPGPKLPPIPVYSKKYPEVSKLFEKYHYSKNQDWVNVRPPTKLGGVYYGRIYELPNWDFTKSVYSPIPTNAMLYFNQLLDWTVGAGQDMWFGEMEPDMAESYEMPDPLTYVFKLHKGVKFHNVPPVNGRECTSEDVRYCYQIYMDKKAPQSIYLTEVNRIDTPDKYTFKLTTSEPVAHIVNTVGARILPIFAKEAYEAPGELFSTTPIGTAAWIFKEYTPKVRHVMVKNPDYFRKDRWGGRLPYLDGAIMYSATDPVQNEAAFRTKQLDNMLAPSIDAFQRLIQEIPGLQAQTIPSFPSVANQIVFKLTKKPWDDIRVRRAMSMAVDRTDMIDTVFRGFGVPRSPVPPNFMGDYWPVPQESQGPYYQYNPEEAKRLLAEAGYPNGFKTSMIAETQSGVNAGSLPYIQAAWKKVGVDCDIVSLDRNAYTAQFEGATFADLGHATLASGGGPDPDVYVSYRTHSKSPGNNMGLNDPKLDDLLQKQRRAQNKAERRKILKEIESYEYDRCYRLYFPSGGSALLVHPYSHVTASHYMGSLDAGQLWQQQFRWFDDAAPKRPPI